MAVLQTSFTASSAIATNGTTTFGYPTRWGTAPDVTTQGDFVGSYGHQAFAEGLQALLNSPKDFTLTFGNSSITFTYLGTTSIPAGSVVKIDLHTIGQDGQPRFTDSFSYSGTAGDVASQANSGSANILGVATRAQNGGFSYINFGTPITSSATTVVNASNAAETLTTVQTLSPAVVLDVARNLIYKSSNAGDTTQTITARGLDEYGQAMTETVTLNGTSSVVGKKAFKTVISWQASATTAGTVSIGVGVLLGSPVFIFSPAASIRDILNQATATAGTWVAGDNSTPSATTGDVRGTYSPNTGPSTNTNTYESLVAVPNPKYLGATQFSG